MPETTDLPRISGFSEAELKSRLEDLQKERSRVYGRIYGRELPRLVRVPVTLGEFIRYLWNLGLVSKEPDEIEQATSHRIHLLRRRRLHTHRVKGD
jgi:hypothetical protein